ncbi:MAG TPA: S-adenosylmethionine decarboxylase [Gemmatimonadaceae bacterium]|jgi:S-adenosylmethionine/arginine decarboxylase-like enzyme|nr:S-adenosylmethionine decarboxylase [Gemmatimonadaceae bacterium]
MADLSGVSPAQLRDTALLSGLLIAGAGGAGFATVGTPVVYTRPNDSVAGVLVLDSCHIALHSFPERELLLLDILAPASHDGRKVIDVFTRRLTPRGIRSEMLPRG